MYSVLERTPLDTAEISLPELGEFAGVVKSVEIPVVTDDELLHRAEQTGNWDSLEAYEYGADESSISFAGLRRRFTEKYLRNKPSDEAMVVGSKFIEAIWESKRQIPTVGEFARTLGERNLLNPREVTMAGRLSELGTQDRRTLYSANLAEKTEQAVHEAMDEDERWLAQHVRSKLTYFINLQPGALHPDTNIAKLAETYASKRAQAQKDPKHYAAARKLLLEARGLSTDEIEAVRGTSSFGNTPERYRRLGIPAELAQQMADNPDTGFMPHPAEQVNRNVVEALEGNLETQLAVRQFFGIENLYKLHQLQARAGQQISIDNTNRGLQAAIFSQAIARGDDATVERMQRQGEAAAAEYEASGPATVFEHPMYTAEERAEFESLAAFAIHEPALRTNLAYFTEGAMRHLYHTWMSAQLSTGSSAKQV